MVPTLRLMRTLGHSLASLAQSSWSLLSDALGGRIASEGRRKIRVWKW